MYWWEKNSGMCPLCWVTPAELTNKEPLMFVSRCQKLGSCCHAHLFSILVQMHLTWALYSRLILAQCVRSKHTHQQELWQLRSQFCLSNVVYLFLHIISVAFHNSPPENATFYKLDGMKMPPRFRLSINFLFKINLQLNISSSDFIYCIFIYLHKAFSSWASNYHW